MSTYVTLETNSSTHVLEVNARNEARTVTTTTAAAAPAIAQALAATRDCTAAALYPVAIEADGNPLDARERLLGTFDAALRAQAQLPRSRAWQHAEGLVLRLVAAVAGEGSAVVDAVRDELARHLVGFEGVLVPATVTADAVSVGRLDLVISAALAELEAEVWEEPFEVSDGHGVTGTNGPVVVGLPATEDVLDLLYGSQPGGVWDDWGLNDIVKAGSIAMSPAYLVVPAKHLKAWLEHQRGPGEEGV